MTFDAHHHHQPSETAALHNPISFEEEVFFHDLLSELEDSFGVCDATTTGSSDISGADDAFSFMLNDNGPLVTSASVRSSIVDENNNNNINDAPFQTAVAATLHSRTTPNLTVFTDISSEASTRSCCITTNTKKGPAVVSPMHMDLIIAACNEISDDDDATSCSVSSSIAMPETPTTSGDTTASGGGGSDDGGDSSSFLSCSSSSSSISSEETSTSTSTGTTTTTTTTSSNKRTTTSTMDKVDHTYVDYSMDTSGSTVQCQVGRKARKPGVFPEKLMMILSKPEHAHIISWLPHGRAFIVRNSNLFGKAVLPTYFKTKQVKSFRKQLSLWGFKRLTRGPDGGAYYHQLFLRGMPSLLKGMRYLKIKGTGKALTPNPEEEPDFYELARRKPLPPALHLLEAPPVRAVSGGGYHSPSPQQMHCPPPATAGSGGSVVAGNMYPNYYANVWGNAMVPSMSPPSRVSLSSSSDYNSNSSSAPPMMMSCSYNNNNHSCAPPCLPYSSSSCQQ